MKIKKEKRYFIYTDASFEITNKKTQPYEGYFQVGIYDRQTHATHTMTLEDIDIKDNNVAEIYGVIYAILYSIKKELNINEDIKVCILTDSQNATTNKKLLALINKYNMNIKHIYRELNEIADKTSRNKDKKRNNLIDLFYKELIE